MRVAIVFFNIWEPGGINTITLGLINGFDREGHTVDYFHASPTGKLRGLDDTRVTGSRYIRIGGEQIGYADEKEVARFKRIVEENYDCLIFALPCPHQTKSSYGDDRTWQRLYRINIPIFVIFHDNLWDKYYKWLEDVEDSISGCLYTVTNAAADSLRRFPTNRFAFLPVLLDTSQAVNKKRRNDNVVWLPQLKKWKGFVEFVEAIPDFEFHVDMYNIGIMYYDLNKKRKEVWTTACRRDYYAKVHPKFNGKFKLNPKGMLDFHGLLLPSKIPSVLKRAGCSVDLTGMVGGDRFKGQITCAMLEPMMYGCVSVVDESMVAHKSSMLYGKEELVWIVDGKQYIASRINELMGSRDLRSEFAKRAMKYVKKYHDSARIVKHLLVPFIEQCSGSWKHNGSVFWSDYKKAMRRK